jgi:hypothetical protein
MWITTARLEEIGDVVEIRGDVGVARVHVQ